MDFSSQKFSDDINIPFIINKLLMQQKKDRARIEEKFYPFIPNHVKNYSMPGADAITRHESHKTDYVKATRALYDHTRSLRHCDCSFSISSVLAHQQNKIFSVKNHLRSKTKSIKIRPTFKEIITKTERILENTAESFQNIENKNSSRYKLISTRQKTNPIHVHVAIPSIRAQTILTCPRKKNASNMIDQEITTDYHNIFPSM